MIVNWGESYIGKDNIPLYTVFILKILNHLFNIVFVPVFTYIHVFLFSG